MTKYLFIFLLAFGISERANSATLYSQAGLNATCHIVNPGGVSACSDINGSSSFALASYGSLKSSAVSSGGNATAVASFSDSIFFGVSQGILSIPVGLSGLGTSINALGQFTGGVNNLFARATMSGSIGATTSTGASGSWSFNSSITEQNDVLNGGTFSTITGSSSFGINTVNFAFSGGVLGIGAAVQTSAFCGPNPSGCLATSDLASTLNFYGATVLDIFGKPLTGVSVTSSSGFNYLAGVGNAPSAVPIPAILPLFLISLASLNLFKRRRMLTLK